MRAPAPRRHRHWIIAAAIAGLAALTSAKAADGLSVETVAEGLDNPWAIAFLPEGALLVTEKTGALKIIDKSGAARTVSGVPEAFVRRQGGLMDVVLHPEFEANSLVYLTLAHGGRGENATRVVRGRLAGDALVDVETVFTAEPAKRRPAHYGARMAFLADGTFVLSVGDGFDAREEAQNPQSHIGKFVRLADDGAVPADNPFVGDPSTRDEIYSLGHRNPQGVAVDPNTGRIWAHEHGPRGGDEVNLIEAGANYGWPIATFGVDYSGAKISPYTEYEGMTGPVLYWTPSIAPAGLAFYSGDLFPEWKGDLFVAALAGRGVGQRIVRVDLEGAAVVGQEALLDDLGYRYRDVREGPDGALYLATDGSNGKILRVVPGSQ